MQGFDAGADDYVAKPFHMEEVLARIRALLRRAAGHASSELVAGPVRLDARAGRVTVDGVAVKLTSHEYRLLSYLMHHAGRIVSRSEIVEHLYDQDFDRDSNTIEVFVGRSAQEARRRRHPDGARARLRDRAGGRAGAGRQTQERPLSRLAARRRVRTGGHPQGAQRPVDRLAAVHLGGVLEFDDPVRRRPRPVGAQRALDRSELRRAARRLSQGAGRQCRLGARRARQAARCR